MSGVELKVVLVGDDQRQQDAFQRPESSATSAQPSGQQSTTQPADDTDAATEAAVRQLNEFLRTSPDGTQRVDGSQDLVVQSLTTLVDLVSRVVETLQKRVKTGGSGDSGEKEKASPKGSSWFADLVELAQNNRIGRAATRAFRSAQTMAGRAMQTGIGKRVAGSAIGRGVARAGAGVAAKLGIGAGSSAAGGAGAAAGGAAVAGSAVALPVAAVVAAFAAAALSVKMFVDAVERASEELMRFSPELATAEAQHEAKRDLQRLDRAQRIGPEMAQVQRAQHHLAEAMYEVQTSIWELLVRFAPIAEGMLNGITFMVNSANVALKTAEVTAAMAAQTAAATAQTAALLTVGNPLDDIAADAAKKYADEYFNKASAALRDAIQEMNGGAPGGMDPYLAQLFTMEGPGVGLAPRPQQGGFP